MNEISRRTYWRAKVLKSIQVGDDCHLEKDVILESDVPPGPKYWVIKSDPEMPFKDTRIPLEYLEVHKMADITFQTLVTIVIDY